MIKLKKVKLADNFGVAAGKYCAMTVSQTIVETDSVVKQAALASGLPAVSIKAAVEAYLAAAETFMYEGHRVRIGKLGLFGVKSKSEATSKIDDVTTRLVPTWRSSSEFRKIVSSIPTEYVSGTVTLDKNDNEVPEDDRII